VSVFCVAEGFDLKALKARTRCAAHMRDRAPNCTSPLISCLLTQRGLANTGWAGRLERVDSDVAYIPYLAPGARADGGSGIAAPPAAAGDVFVFDYGVAACWGLTSAQEEAVLAALLGGGTAAGALPASLRERDAFEVAFAPGQASSSGGNKGLCSILNGVVTLDARFQAQPALAQLAVSHAIAQSTKLCVFESRVTRLAEASAHIPSAMAAAGEVRMPRREAARLTGQLFLQRSAVNLLSTVLDVPDFLWDSADELQGVYSAVTKYLELKNRVAVLNARYAVLETMLTMVQSQLNDNHASRLEWIMCAAPKDCNAARLRRSFIQSLTRAHHPAQHLAHRGRDWPWPRGAVSAARRRAGALSGAAPGGDEALAHACEKRGLFGSAASAHGHHGCIVLLRSAQARCAPGLRARLSTRLVTISPSPPRAPAFTVISSAGATRDCLLRGCSAAARARGAAAKRHGMRCQAFALRLPPAPPAAPPAARSRPAHALPGCTRRPLLRSVAARSVPPERASLYETLGVAVGASSEAVKRAYRRLALRHARHAEALRRSMTVEAALTFPRPRCAGTTRTFRARRMRRRASRTSGARTRGC
jgi:uncharacterized Rmd1/YagE family protein